MILVTISHRNGIAFDSPKTIAIDPEKIVSTKDNGAFCVLEYGETYDRRRQPIIYQVTVDRATINALITGTYAGKEYLALTVIASNTDIYRPYLEPNYILDLQEKYIVDIRSTYIWINQTKTACSRIEFVPGAFVPVIIWVSEDIDDLITEIAGATTTTSTAEPAEATTSSEEEVVTTSSEAEGATTTTWPDDVCYWYTLTNTNEQEVAVFGLYYCTGRDAALEVAYGQPVEVCLRQAPILLAGEGTAVRDGICSETTTTSTEEEGATTSSEAEAETTSTLIPCECEVLGDAARFAVLGNTSVSDAGSSVVNGDLGVSPGVGYSGFPPGVVNGTEHITDQAAADAQISAQAAYDCLHGLSPVTRLVAQLGGTTQTAGIYDFDSSAQITGTLILDGELDPDAVFVFIIPSTLTTATDSIVSLINGAQAGNVYWLVGSSATIGIRTTMKGNIIAVTAITFNTTATLDGRAFALGAAIVLDGNVISCEDCSINPCTEEVTTTSTEEVAVTTSSEEEAATTSTEEEVVTTSTEEEATTTTTEEVAVTTTTEEEVTTTTTEEESATTTTEPETTTTSSPGV